MIFGCVMEHGYNRGDSLISLLLNLLKIHNMRKYVARNQIKKTQMPENAVQFQNMLLHPISLQMCEKIGGHFFVHHMQLRPTTTV